MLRIKDLERLKQEIVLQQANNCLFNWNQRNLKGTEGTECTGIIYLFWDEGISETKHTKTNMLMNRDINCVELWS